MCLPASLLASVEEYMVPGVVVLAVYAKIFFVVRRHRRAVAAALPPSVTVRHRPTADHIGASAAKKLFIIYLAYWLMYGPKAITVVRRDVPTWFAFFADWVNLGGAVSNAGLYVVLHESVREELRKLFRRRLNVVHDRHTALPIIRY